MPYSAEISRENPSCFLFLIDQSGSMSDNFFNTSKSKAQGVSDAINKLISNLVIKCAKSEGVRNYYHIGVIGYGSNVGGAFSGILQNKDLVPINDVANNPARIEERTRKVDDNAGGLVDTKIKFPIWFDPIANGGTPMCQAFDKANEILKTWLQEHPNSFPPVVIHITDGESTDGDPSQKMKELTNLSSTDGNVLLFNLHVSSKDVNKLSFPNNENVLPDEYSTMLYSNASQLTPFMLAVANNDYGLNLSEKAKAFTLNADLEILIPALEIGTRPSNMR